MGGGAVRGGKAGRQQCPRNGSSVVGRSSSFLTCSSLPPAAVPTDLWLEITI